MGQPAEGSNYFLGVQWIPCCIKDKEYIVKYVFHPTSYQILLSDLACVYCEEMDNTAVLHRSKELNPKIEIETPGILRELQHILEKWVKNAKSNNDEVTILSQNSAHFILKFESLLAGVSFVWQFNMTAQDSSVLFTHVVHPLFGIACEFKRRNHELMKIIKRKDAQIEDYKENGAKSSFKYLETEVFKEEEFVQSMDKIENITESLKRPLETVFNDSLCSRVSLAIQDLSRNKSELPVNEDAVAVKKIKSCDMEKEVTSAVNDEEHVESNRDLLVHQRLQPKVKKKPKKKFLKI